MSDEQLLRERLNEVAVPPMDLVMDQVVAEGVRKVRRRRTATVSAAAVVSLGLLVAVPALTPDDRNTGVQLPAAPSTPSAVPPALTCKTTGVLEKPKNVGDPVVVSTDPTGRYVVGHGSKGQDFIPLFWADGKVHRVSYPEDSAELIDVNSSGVAVGRGSDGGSGPDTFFRYADGKITELQTPPGHWNTLGWPQINTAGEVLATVQPKENIEGRGAVILLWPAGSAKPERLPLPTNADSDIIADNGTIAGVLRNRAGKKGYETEGMQSLPQGTAEDGTLAYVWDRTGKGRQLETPAGYSSAGYSISSDGAWVTGGLWDDAPGAARDPETGLWNVATGKLVAKVDNDDVGNNVSPGGLVLTQGGAVYDKGKRVTFAKDVGIGAMTDTNGFVDQKLRTWQC
ncbi:hypothetical protein [Actinoplanes derwentensis]|uniref:Uncharacterized protein n=1 Tax=Actinoplanes derwentensis TaxID=113562 RepID=A0A1H2B7S5_9ACTN|nr:hypothetical protein [Actinoplanes derwentensis]GID86421.1 hypothetical protein Ade03nite_53450 [Actinoplanes derwentensis]SDT53969.1 hypothetical protein SAMN04489716_4388 [Actinoplanes derwentensis]